MIHFLIRNVKASPSILAKFKLNLHIKIYKHKNDLLKEFLQLKQIHQKLLLFHHPILYHFLFF